VGTNRIEAWPLDARGQRRSPLALAGDAASTTLDLTPAAATLWYEIRIRPAPTGYTLWREQNFSTEELANPVVSADLATPAGDGVPTLWKYAFGLAAKTVAPVDVLPRACLWAESGEAYLALTYRRAVGTADLDFLVETAAGLGNWLTGTEATRLVATESDGAAQRLTVRDLWPVRTSPSRFIRLRLRRLAAL
jgi:hypothetical protein